MKRLLLVFTVLTFGFLTACSSQPAQQSELDLKQFEDQSVTWQGCPTNYFLESSRLSSSFRKPEVKCATVRVPAQYVTGVSLPDFKIAMMKQPAGGEKKIGTLFINPGGPGGSGIEQLQWLNFPKAISDSYDIIGFDPRGVNHSAPVSGNQIKCSTQSDYETYWSDESTPANDKEYLATIDTLDAYYKKCSADNPSWWTMSTKNVVSDLDLMRSVITGTAPLNFLGSSYGTTIAAEYITRYPENVGHIALDSPTTNDPTKPADEIARAKALEANVMRLVNGYAEAKDMSVEEVKRLMLKVRQDGDDDKLVGFAGMKILDATNGTRLSTEYMFTHGILALTYYDIDVAQKYFNQGLDEVSGPAKWNGLFESLAMELDGYNPNTLGGTTYDPGKIERDNSFEVMDIVNSMDLDYSKVSDEVDDEKLANQIKKVSPFWTALTHDSSNYEYKGDRDGLDWTQLAKEDDKIPDPPTEKPVRSNTSGKKALVVGARYESTTPYVFAVKTAQDLKSPLVTFNGTGHAPLAGFDNKCLNDISIRFFVDGIAPSAPVTCNK